jgi:hypothetical protein
MSKMKTWSRGGRNRAVLHGWWVLTIMGIWIVTLQCPSITAGRLRTLLCTSFTQPAGEIVSHFWCFLITFKWSCGLGILYRWMFVRKNMVGGICIHLKIWFECRWFTRYSGYSHIGTCRIYNHCSVVLWVSVSERKCNYFCVCLTYTDICHMMKRLVCFVQAFSIVCVLLSC